MTGAFVPDGGGYGTGLWIYHQNLTVQITGDVEQARGICLDAMRRAVGGNIDLLCYGVSRQIDHVDFMPGVGVLPVDAVAVNGDIGKFVIRGKHKIVGVLFRPDAGNFSERYGIEEAEMRAQLVDHEDALRAGRVVELSAGEQGRCEQESCDAGMHWLQCIAGAAAGTGWRRAPAATGVQGCSTLPQRIMAAVRRILRSIFNKDRNRVCSSPPDRQRMYRRCSP